MSQESQMIQPPLPSTPPLVWPEPRWHAGHGRYVPHPPFQDFLAKVDLLAGVLVGAADSSIHWLETLLSAPIPRRVLLVVVVAPAGPTREEHLKALESLQAQHQGPQKEFQVRVLPADRAVGADYEKSTLPPTTLLAHSTHTGETWLSIGSVGDTGHDDPTIASFNAVFHPDDALRDAWRRWFHYLFESAAPLTTETVRVPHLVPAQGDPAAAELWAAFQQTCLRPAQEHTSPPTVDPETGEVEAKPWDDGITALDPLGQIFQQVYASGWLVTVDEATRIKPLSIPVKATLLGQQSARIVGALTQTQAFTLQVLGDEADKAIEKCRKVTDVMELLTYPLSQGNRWLPEAARGLLEKEIESRNEQGRKALREALGGLDIKTFVANRAERIRKNLNEMYRQLGQGDAVPDDKLKAVLDEVERRLTKALDARITPRAVYNRIGAPNLTATAPDENWNQPLSLLTRSARTLRESLADHYFPRKFSGLAFSDADFRRACDVFGDVIVQNQESGRAKEELNLIEGILDGELPSKEKCRSIWQLITGAKPPRADST